MRNVPQLFFFKVRRRKKLIEVNDQMLFKTKTNHFPYESENSVKKCVGKNIEYRIYNSADRGCIVFHRFDLYEEKKN